MSMTMKSGSAMRFEDGSWQEVAHDVYMGLIVGFGHFFRICYQMPYKLLFGTDPYEQLGSGKLKVVGVGFGRTGTYSVKLALEELGIKTLHTQHLYEAENDHIFKMWTEQIFRPALETGHAELGYPDFSTLTGAGYEGTMDFPTALYYEQILEQYPDCKFILTVRENSEVWYRSWNTLATSISGAANIGGVFFSEVHKYSTYLRWLFAVVNKDDEFITSSIPKVQQSKDAAIESYETHNRRVRELIPPGQLLEYSVKQGWEPLCDFLEIADCPTTPFPKTNSARSLQVQGITSAMISLVPVLFILFYLFATVFQRVTGRTVMQWFVHQTMLLPASVRKMLLLGDSEKEIQAKKASGKKQHAA
eukprot:Nitzschia sp. Nitz4//scaffold152_size53828//26263//27487//NITZ4_006742-RA/size53828-augustus-gene-0.97-mRNA-1//-1//CDS//3329537202//8278//frame0